MKKKTLSFFILGISLFSSSLVFADSQTQGEVAMWKAHLNLTMLAVYQLI
ncbi:hypothetical protein MOW07_12610 [Enterococcus hirae]|nr:hypothetical protein [Enterococcus hirae]UQN39095.1 hypothetical protein MOW07_12610 [Enterococcus hirae]